MIKLYLKTISASLLILFLVLSGFYLFFTHSIRISSQKVQDILATGNFAVLEQILLDSSKKSHDELKKLFPENSNIIQIISMDSLPFSETEKKQLFANKIVYKNEKDRMFLTYSLHDLYAYKKMGKSRFILKIQAGTSMNDIIKSSTWLMRTLIVHSLKSIPENQWNEALNILQRQYQMPLKLESINSKSISESAKKSLIHEAVFYKIPPNEEPITTLYFKIPDSEKIITMGPLKYPYFSVRLSRIQIYFVVSMLLLSTFSVAMLTWLFSRNSAKIYKLTQEYSKGHFGYETHISHISTLRGLYDNVVAMGNKIHLLMQSQQNMARFVAHEVRTPLYTIQLAFDALKKLKIQSGKELEHIESIEEDIQELNRLISTFLLYSQSSTHELKIHRELLNIRTWLENLIKNHQSYEVAVLFTYQNSENECIYFDPKLLFHAVNNLVSNALKYACKKILISLEYKNKSVFICVNDDGPGVPKPDREKIIEPFSTLNSGDTTNKHFGLGLSITKSIMELHQGNLLINDSMVLKGASFTLVLPVNPENFSGK